MDEKKPYRERTWPEKFHDAFRGLKEGVRGQSSFLAHFLVTAAVIAAAAVVKMGPSQWCVLLLCITIVLTAEMLNSGLESLARAITDQTDPHIRTALNIGSAAVLVAAIGAAIVGAIVLVSELAGRW